MKDYYEILNLDKNADQKKIKETYKNHIMRFNGLPFLTDRMIKEIKDLKKAYYVLGNPTRKNLYDNRNKSKKQIFQLNDNNIDFSENTKINDRIFGDIFTRKII